MTADTLRLRASRTFWFIAGGAAYVLLGCLLVYVIYYRSADLAAGSEGVYDLGFFFGPLVKNIAKGSGCFGDAFGMRFTAHRMPLLALLLSAVARLHNSLLAAVLVKNGLLGGLLMWAVYRARPLITRLPAAVVAALALLGLSMPQVLHFGFCLEMEEGYLIAPVLFLFVHFILLTDRSATDGQADLRRAPWGATTWMMLALADGSLFLIKSGMLPTALLFAALFWAGTRHFFSAGGRVHGGVDGGGCRGVPRFPAP